MRDFILLIAEMFGYAMILGFFATLLNYYFDWRLGIYDVEMPDDPYIGIYFLVIGLIITIGVYFLNKKFPAKPSE
ncbi:MAG: hypothetical protein R2681_18295 [Pyrinomonadaceae bacterium]